MSEDATVLCVDDDPALLEAVERNLCEEFDLVTATGGAAGLELLDAGQTFAVVVSDMRMPGMDGIEFLSRFAQRCPHTVRLMLTGNADQQTAIAAINEGRIFRFLSKPCPTELLASGVRDALRQYRLVTAERELLEQTLRGSVKLLTDLLAVANPQAYQLAAEARTLAVAVARQLQQEQTWQVELAAMLSQIGALTLPPDLLPRAALGETLSTEEALLVAGHPHQGAQLLRNIPRLGPVAEIVALQAKRYDGLGPPAGHAGGTAIPLGGRILKTVLDFAVLRQANGRDREALAALAEREGWYCPTVLAALTQVLAAEQRWSHQRLTLKELRTGMVLDENVVTTKGVLLVPRGHELSDTALARVRNFARLALIVEPIRVLVRQD